MILFTVCGDNFFLQSAIQLSGGDVHIHMYICARLYWNLVSLKLKVGSSIFQEIKIKYYWLRQLVSAGWILKENEVTSR